jgi:hypothetical protein
MDMIWHNDISIQTYIRVSAVSQNAFNDLAIFRQLNVRQGWGWDARDAVDSVPYGIPYGVRRDGVDTVPYDLTQQFRAVFYAYCHIIRAVLAVIISL